MCRNVHRDNTLQCFDVCIITSVRVVLLGLAQLLTNIATEIFIRHFHFGCGRVLEAKSTFNNLLAHIAIAHVQLLSDIWNIDTSVKIDAGNDTVFNGCRLRLALGLHDTTAENVSLAVGNNTLSALVTCLTHTFQCGNTWVVHIAAQERNGSVLVQMSVGLDKTVVCLVQLGKTLLQTAIVAVGSLILQHVGKCILDSLVSVETLCLGVSLNLVGIDVDRHGFSSLCKTQIAVAVK